jgi:general secretion pathway protein G
MYPTQQQGLIALVKKPDIPPIPTNWRHYLDKLPNDPWGNPYQYLNPGVKGNVDVLSYGKNGSSANESGNHSSIIGSWQNN